MGRGEFFTRATIWITIAGYAVGAAAFARSRNRYGWDSLAGLGWTIACVILLAHVACAFHFYHGWSHKIPYTGPGFVNGEVDAVLVVNTYHHLEDRATYFAKVKRGLKEGGKLVVVDFKLGTIPVGPPEEMRAAALQCRVPDPETKE